MRYSTAMNESIVTDARLSALFDDSLKLLCGNQRLEKNREYLPVDFFGAVRKFAIIRHEYSRLYHDDRHNSIQIPATTPQKL